MEEARRWELTHIPPSSLPRSFFALEKLLALPQGVAAGRGPARGRHARAALVDVDRHPAVAVVIERDGQRYPARAPGLRRHAERLKG